MTLRSSWLTSAAVLGCAVVVGCAKEPPRRPLQYGTSGNRPAQVVGAHEPFYEQSLGSGTISGSAGAATRPVNITGGASTPTGADLPPSPAVGASGAPVTPGTPGPAAPGAGEVAVPPPADAGAATPNPAPAPTPGANP